ncbi:MAG: hypothetical protein NTV32_09255 [Gammaproteobacteria bacterium]|nr:hypothetical protein [Gammaproteobacteria bacterium]
MMMFFVFLQFLLLFFMLFHDWIPVPPFNNTAALKKVDGSWGRLKGSIINGITVLIPLWLTLKYIHTSMPQSALTTIVCFYLGISIGTIFSWWIPYFFGSSTQHKDSFQKFKQTHHFLPERGDHVVPNTLHVLLHLQVWVCLLISVYFLFSSFMPQ